MPTAEHAETKGDGDAPPVDSDVTVEAVCTHWFYRHDVAVRVFHWTNAFCFFVLLMSGLQIFNAHPALYWGNVSTFDTPAFAIVSDDNLIPRGETKIAGRGFETTGWLGATGADGTSAFPQWATLPSTQDLATGRRWHFLFAWLLVLNGVAYLVYGFVRGRLWRRMTPDARELRHIPRAILDHLLLRFPKGEAAKRYNVLQKISYLVVIFLLFPVQILAGLAMSPGMNAVAPFLLDLFGGRQSARTVHFIVASLLVAFVIVHVLMVVASGLFNNLRSMTTGWFIIGRKTIAREPPRETAP